MTRERRVCFHSKPFTACPFCSAGGSSTPRRPRRRCHACGRFRAARDLDGPSCPPCTDRGFVPLTLFP